MLLKQSNARIFMTQSVWNVCKRSLELSWCFYSRYQHPNGQLPQQQQQQQHAGAEENIYANDGVMVAQSKPELVYAQIVPSLQASDSGIQGQDEVISSTVKQENSAIIYSELQENIDSLTLDVAPSDELYANM